MKFSHWINSKPIRFKIASSVISAVVLVLFITTLIQVRTNSKTDRMHLVNELETLTQVTSHSLNVPLWNYNTSEITNICEALFINQSVSSVDVLDKELGIIYHKKNEGPEYLDKYLYSSTVPVIHKDTIIGYLEINVTEYFLMKEIQGDFRSRIFVIVVLSTILAALISYITTLFIRPLHQLNEAVERITEGKYTKSIQIFAEDEIGKLSNNFNKMSDKLQESDRSIKKMNEDLENKVEQRTMEINLKNIQLEASMSALEETQKELIESNNNLTATLETLKHTQNELIQSGKMALLGGLVAGVAHEVNTPIGVSLTASSFLQKEIAVLNDKIYNGTLKKSELLAEVKIFEESSTSIVRNLTRAAELINSFKQVAVDQTSHDIRKFKLKQYINETLLNLHSKYRHRNVNIENNCDDQIELLSYPGVYAQIFTNLVLNTLIHGFENKSEGNITIHATQKKDRLIIKYTDDGIGIPETIISKIFDPFFTTKRGQGGSGLGLNIVYNLVTQVLKGTITCDSDHTLGTTFTIDVPFKHPDVENQIYIS